MNKAVKSVDYFLGRREGFDRLFSAFLKKFQRYGAEVNGKVVLKNPSKAEKECISSFTGKDYLRSASISITFRKFEEILNQREFGVTDIKTLLEQYYEQPLLTGKEENDQKELEYSWFIEKIRSLSTNQYYSWYVDSLESKSSGYRRFIKYYREDSARLLENLKQLAAGAVLLPLEKNVRLPYFSTKVTGNPHVFDTNRELGRLLIDLVYIAFLHEGKRPFQYETNAEQIRELLLSVGILKDDLTNSVGFTGLQIDEESGAESLLYKESYRIGKVNLEPLREVIKFSGASSYWSNKEVFVVEGSGIFSTIVDEVYERTGKVPPLICTFGQFKVAGIKLMDMLVKNGYTIWYSGDHDPKGVLMAQQLINRFGDVVVPWGYTEEYYRNTTSKERMDTTVLAPLNSVNHKGLLRIKDLLLVEQAPCYQEDFTSKLVEDILRGY